MIKLRSQNLAQNTKPKFLNNLLFTKELRKLSFNEDKLTKMKTITDNLFFCNNKVKSIFGKNIPIIFIHQY